MALTEINRYYVGNYAVTTGANIHGGWLPENGGIKLRIDADGAAGPLTVLGSWGAVGTFLHVQYFYEA